MVPKLGCGIFSPIDGFRAVLFRMVPKLGAVGVANAGVLELCCFEWFQNYRLLKQWRTIVLELCCFEWFQNIVPNSTSLNFVLELCCFEWFQNI